MSEQPAKTLTGLEVTLGTTLGSQGLRRVTTKSGTSPNLSGHKDAAVYIWACYSASPAVSPIVHVRLRSASPDESSDGTYKRIPRDLTGGSASQPVFLETLHASIDAANLPITGLMLVDESAELDPCWEELLQFPRSCSGQVFKLACQRGAHGNGPGIDGQAACAMSPAGEPSSWLQALSAGSSVDAHCLDGVWRSGRVMQMHESSDGTGTGAGREVHVTFQGWPERFNEIIISPACLAPPYTKAPPLLPTSAHMREHRGTTSAAALAPLALLHSTAARLAAVVLGHVAVCDADAFLSHDLPFALTNMLICSYEKGAKDLREQAGLKPTYVRDDDIDLYAMDIETEQAPVTDVAAQQASSGMYAHLYASCLPTESQGEGGAVVDNGFDTGPVPSPHTCFPGAESLYSCSPPPGPAAITRRICARLAASSQPSTTAEYAYIANDVVGIALAWAAVQLRVHHAPLRREADLILRSAFLMDDERSTMWHSKWNICGPKDPTAQDAVKYATGFASRLCMAGASTLFAHNITVMHEVGGYAAIVDRLRAHASISEEVARCSTSSSTSSTSSAVSTGVLAAGDASNPVNSVFHNSAASLEEDCALVVLHFKQKYCVNKPYAAHYYAATKNAILGRLAAASEVQLKRAAPLVIGVTRDYMFEIGKHMIEAFVRSGSYPECGSWISPEYPAASAPKEDALCMAYAIVFGPKSVPAGACEAGSEASAQLRNPPQLLEAFELNKVVVGCKLLHCDALALRVKGLADINAVLEEVKRDEKRPSLQSLDYIAKGGRNTTFDRFTAAALMRQHRVIDLVLAGPGKVDSLDARLPAPTGRGDVDSDAIAGILPALRLCAPHVQLITRLAYTVEFMAATSMQAREVMHKTALSRTRAKAEGDVVKVTQLGRRFSQFRDIVRDNEAKVLSAAHLVLLWQAWAASPEYEEMRRAVLDLISRECFPYLTTYQNDVLYARLRALSPAVLDNGLIDFMASFSSYAIKQWETEVKDGGQALCVHEDEESSTATLLATGISWMDEAIKDPRNFHHWYCLTQLWAACHEPGLLPAASATGSGVASPALMMSTICKLTAQLKDRPAYLTHYLEECARLLSEQPSSACPPTYSSRFSIFVLLKMLIETFRTAEFDRQFEVHERELGAYPTTQMSDEAKRDATIDADARVVELVCDMERQQHVLSGMVRDTMQYYAAALLEARAQGIQVEANASHRLMVAAGYSEQQAEAAWAASAPQTGTALRNAPLNVPSTSLAFASRHTMYIVLKCRLQNLKWWGTLAGISLELADARSLWFALAECALTCDIRELFMDWLQDAAMESVGEAQAEKDVFLPEETSKSLFREFMCGEGEIDGSRGVIGFDIHTAGNASLNLLHLWSRIDAGSRGIMYRNGAAETCLLSPVLPASSLMWQIAMSADDEAVATQAGVYLMDLYIGCVLLLPHAYALGQHARRIGLEQARAIEAECINNLQSAARKEGLSCLMRVLPHDPQYSVDLLHDIRMGHLHITSATAARCFFVALCMSLIQTVKADAATGKNTRALCRLIVLLNKFLVAVDYEHKLSNADTVYSGRDTDDEVDILKGAKLCSDLLVDLRLPPPSPWDIEHEAADSIEKVSGIVLELSEVKAQVREPGIAQSFGYNNQYYNSYQQPPNRVADTILQVRSYIERVGDIRDRVASMRGLNPSRVVLNAVIPGGNDKYMKHPMDDDARCVIEHNIGPEGFVSVTSGPAVPDGEGAQDPRELSTRQSRVMSQVKKLCAYRRTHRAEASSAMGEEDASVTESEGSDSSALEPQPLLSASMENALIALEQEEVKYILDRYDEDVAEWNRMWLLPRRTLSDTPAYFDQLFALLGAGGEGTSEGLGEGASSGVISSTWSLISSLPVSSQLQENVSTLWGVLPGDAHDHAPSAPACSPDWPTLLDGASPLKLLFMLIVMEKAIAASAVVFARLNGAEEQCTPAQDSLARVHSDWSRAFVRSGGASHLHTLLMTMDPCALFSHTAAGQGGLLRTCAASLLTLATHFFVSDLHGLRHFSYLSTLSSPSPVSVSPVNRPLMASRMLEWISAFTTSDVPVEGKGEGGEEGLSAQVDAGGVFAGTGSSTTPPASALSSPSRPGTGSGAGSRVTAPHRTPVRISKVQAVQGLPSKGVAGGASAAVNRSNDDSDDDFAATGRNVKSVDASFAREGREAEGRTGAAQSDQDVRIVANAFRFLISCLVGADLPCDSSSLSLVQGRDKDPRAPMAVADAATALEDVLALMVAPHARTAAPHARNKSPTELQAPHGPTLRALQCFPSVGQVLATALVCPSGQAVRAAVAGGLLKLASLAMTATRTVLPSLPGAYEDSHIAESRVPRDENTSCLPTALLDTSSQPTSGMTFSCWLVDILLRNVNIAYAFPTRCSLLFEVALKKVTCNAAKNAKEEQSESILGNVVDAAGILVTKANTAAMAAAGKHSSKLMSQEDAERLRVARAAALSAAIATFDVRYHIQCLIEVLRAHPVVETSAEENSPRDIVLWQLLTSLHALLDLPGVDSSLKEWVGRPIRGPDSFSPIGTAGPGLGLVDELFQVCLFTLPQRDSDKGGSASQQSSISSVLGAGLPRCKQDIYSRQAATNCLKVLARACLPNAARTATHFLQHHDAEAIGLPSPEFVVVTTKKGKGGAGRRRLNTDSGDEIVYPLPQSRRSTSVMSPKADAGLDTILPLTHPLLNKRGNAGKSPRSGAGYVGLHNLGCICYMNSSLQHFFMNALFRKRIMSFRVPTDMSEDDKADCLPLQMQLLFAQLQESDKLDADPRDLTKAIKDWDGQATNVYEQKDVPEFMTKLFADWEMATQGTPLAFAPKEVYGGLSVQELLATDPRPPGTGASGILPEECAAGPGLAPADAQQLYRSRDEDFFYLQVRVKNSPHLDAALQAYVAGETVDYKWELPVGGEDGDGGMGRAGSAVGPSSDAKEKEVTLPTIKRTSLKSVGRHLMIHLSRFDFNLETLQQEKLNDRFEFPRRLDLWPYTVWGRPDAQAGAEQATGGIPARSDFYYELVGVVVHSGTAVGGHYYSYIRERDSEQGPLPGDSWFQFNDSRVCAWGATDAMFDEECFGGMTKAINKQNTWSNNMSWVERPKVANAFCLFYERVQVHRASTGPSQDSFAPQDTLDRVVRFRGDAAAVPVPGSAPFCIRPLLLRLPADTRAVQARVLRLQHGSGSERARQSMRAPLPPALASAFLEENTVFWRTYYIFSMVYFDCLEELVKHASTEATAAAKTGVQVGGEFPWSLLKRDSSDAGVPMVDSSLATRLGGLTFPLLRLAAAFLLNTMPDGTKVAMDACERSWFESVRELALLCPVGALWFLSAMAQRPSALLRVLLTDKPEAEAEVQQRHVCYQRQILVKMLGACLTAVWMQEGKQPADPELAALLDAMPNPLGYVPADGGAISLRIGFAAPAFFSALCAVTLPHIQRYTARAHPLVEFLCTQCSSVSGPSWCGLGVRAGMISRLIDLLVGHPASPCPTLMVEGRAVGVQGYIDVPESTFGSSNVPTVLLSVSSASSAVSWPDPGTSSVSDNDTGFHATTTAKASQPVAGKFKKDNSMPADVVLSTSFSRPALSTSWVEGIQHVLTACGDMARTAAVPGRGLKEESPYALPEPGDRLGGRPSLSALDMSSLACPAFVQLLVSALSLSGEKVRRGGTGSTHHSPHEAVRKLLGHLLWKLPPTPAMSERVVIDNPPPSPSSAMFASCLAVAVAGMQMSDSDGIAPFMRLAILLIDVAGDSDDGFTDARTDAVLTAIMPVLVENRGYYAVTEKALSVLVWAARDRPRIVAWFCKCPNNLDLTWAINWLKVNDRPPLQYAPAVGGVVLLKFPPSPYNMRHESYMYSGGRDLGFNYNQRARDPSLAENVSRLVRGLPPRAYRLDTEDEPLWARGKRVRLTDVQGAFPIAAAGQARMGMGGLPSSTRAEVYRLGRVQEYSWDHNGWTFQVELEPVDATPRGVGATPPALSHTPRASPSTPSGSGRRQLLLYDPRAAYEFLPDTGDAWEDDTEVSSSEEGRDDEDAHDEPANENGSDTGGKGAEMSSRFPNRLLPPPSRSLSVDVPAPSFSRDREECVRTGLHTSKSAPAARTPPHAPSGGVSAPAAPSAPPRINVAPLPGYLYEGGRLSGDSWASTGVAPVVMGERPAVLAKKGRGTKVGRNGTRKPARKGRTWPHTSVPVDDSGSDDSDDYDTDSDSDVDAAVLQEVMLASLQGGRVRSRTMEAEEEEVSVVADACERDTSCDSDGGAQAGSDVPDEDDDETELHDPERRSVPRRLLSSRPPILPRHSLLAGLSPLRLDGDESEDMPPLQEDADERILRQVLQESLESVRTTDRIDGISEAILATFIRGELGPADITRAAQLAKRGPAETID